IIVGASIFMYRKKLNALKPTVEHYTKNKDPELGAPRVVNKISLRPKLPNLAIPLRQHVNIWITKVPLTPFTSPLLVLPPFIGTFPNFLLYKPSLLTPTINQGDCGSCWAFMTCDILSDRLMVRTGGLFRKNLSVQQLLSCYNRNGCDGDSPETALVWMAQNQKRLALASKDKYVQQSGGLVSTACRTKSTGIVGVEPQSVKSIVRFIPETGYDKRILKQNIINMKRELVERGPFFCAMTVYDDFMTYTGTKVYSRESTDIRGGHAVEVIGYSDAGVDKRKGFTKAYWICKSSWGENWPTETDTPGYFMIEMGKNMCGIESRAGIASPQVFATFSLEGALPISQLRYTNIDDYLNST
ncbi:hypothetical protein OAV62_02145, partial [bacterium]|nr:hypothetical protein [bacterium]